MPRNPINTVGQVEFSKPLRIPPLDEGSVSGTTRTFALTLQTGMTSIVGQGDTASWGVNGTILGPTLRARRGDTVHLNVTNQLPEVTSVHWHGMRLPAIADGGPHQMIEPTQVWSPTWTIDQQAGTLWYHPHPHGNTEKHVHRGIAGLFLLDDEESEALALPAEYGVDDIPIIVQDRTFDDKGAFVETVRKDNGMLGDTIMVNATVGAQFTVQAELTRLRILNASAARSYNFGFADDRNFQLISTDGGLLAAPVTQTRLMLSPGERADVVVSMKPSESVVLRSYPQDLGVTQRIADGTGAADEMDIMQLLAPATLRPSPTVPASLATLPTLDPATAAQTRIFQLGNNRINGQGMNMSRIDAEVAANSVEVWEVINVHTRPHNFHIHDVQFRIIDIDGNPPPPELAGWKDTFYTPPQVRFRLVMKFGSHTDAHVPYMFHCHLLWHEDQGMMGQFVVV